jgi:AcrR family transcriptional regulator
MRGTRRPTSRPAAPPAPPAVRGSEVLTPDHATLTAEIGRRPYKQVARAEAQRRTREALLDAAMEEFTRGRWEKVSLQELAGRAKVTKQTLLRHFGSKDGLLMQAMASSAAEMYTQRWSTRPGDVEDAVENVLDHYEEWGERSLRVGAWLESGPPVLANISQLARQMHYDWVEYAFGPQLERRHGEQRVRCRAALIALCDVHTWWLLSHDLGFDRAAARATIATAIERLLAEGDEERGTSAEGQRRTRKDAAEGQPAGSRRPRGGTRRRP